MKVWAIYYKLKMGGVWSKDWHGPIYIGSAGKGIKELNDENIRDMFCMMPLFLRTKKQALKVITQLNRIDNKNKKWTQHKAVPMELSWKAINSLTR